MRLNFYEFPLDIYKEDESISLLRTIEKEYKLNNSDEVSESGKTIFGYLGKLLLTFIGMPHMIVINKLSMLRHSLIASQCVSQLIEEQIERTKSNPSVFLREARLNLMTTYCVTRYLAHLEGSMISQGANDLVRSFASMVLGRSFKDYYSEKSIIINERSEKYENFCEIYFIAFLLWEYKLMPDNRDLIKNLIQESLCNDENGETSFIMKKRPLLFSDHKEKNLYDNMTYGIYYVSQQTKHMEELRDSFVKPYMEVFKEELGEI